MAITCDHVRELASGFVLGALEPDEMAAVRDHLDSCREPHPELAELGGILPYLAVTPEPARAACVAAWLRDMRPPGQTSWRGERVGQPAERQPVEPAAAMAAACRPLLDSLPRTEIISLDAARRSRRRTICDLDDASGRGRCGR